MEVNKIYNENCLHTMQRMQDNYIDLTVTSPPYDNLRDYKGFKFPFKHIARHLYRVTKWGGVVVWVVADATINGSETGTSFRQALFFMECGFRLHDTMIYGKDSIPFPESNRYSQTFEYMFVFSKGKPDNFNAIKDRRNKHAGTTVRGHERLPSGDIRYKPNKGILKDFSSRFNIWTYSIGGYKPEIKEHPAVFPEDLAADHIKSWSNEGDLIYDPFGGSGTTAKMAHLLKRQWIMSEMSAEYCDLAARRLRPYLNQLQLL